MDSKKYYIRSVYADKKNYSTVNLPIQITKKLDLSRNDYVKMYEQENKIILERVALQISKLSQTGS